MAVKRRENNASINAEAPPLGKTISLNMSSSMAYSNVSGVSELLPFQVCNIRNYHKIRTLSFSSFIRSYSEEPLGIFNFFSGGGFILGLFKGCFIRKLSYTLYKTAYHQLTIFDFIIL